MSSNTNTVQDKDEDIGENDENDGCDNADEKDEDNMEDEVPQRQRRRRLPPPPPSSSLDCLEIIESNSSLTEGTTSAPITPSRNDDADDDDEGEAVLASAGGTPRGDPIASHTHADASGSSSSPAPPPPPSTQQASASASAPPVPASGGGSSSTTNTENSSSISATNRLQIQPAVSYVSSASSTTGTVTPGGPFTPSSTQSSQPSPLPQTFQQPQTQTEPVVVVDTKQQQSQQSQSQLQQYPPSPPTSNRPPVAMMMMTTIANSSPRSNAAANPTIPSRKDSDDVMNIPPVHPFFHQPYFASGSGGTGSGAGAGGGGGAHYDSDGSDGSFVQKRRRPSFDNNSLASNGSVKYISSSSAPSSPGGTGGQGQGQVRSSSNPFQPQTQTQQSQPPAPVNPQMLPYHERRKLMKIRQQLKQQQQQQQQQQRPQPPLPLPPSQQHQFQQHAYRPGASSDPNYRYPPQSQQQLPPPMASASASAGLDPRLYTPDLSQPMMLPPAGYGTNTTSSNPQHQHYHPQHPHLPPHAQSMPYPPYGMDPAQVAAFMNMYGMPPPPMPPQMAPGAGYNPYGGYPPPPSSFPPGYPPPPNQGYPPGPMFPLQPQPQPQPPGMPPGPYGYPIPPPQQQQQQQQQQHSYAIPQPFSSAASTNGNAVQPRLSPYRTIGKQAPAAPSQQQQQQSTASSQAYDPRRPPKANSQRPPVPATNNNNNNKALAPPSSSNRLPSTSVVSSSSAGSTVESRPPPPPPPPPPPFLSAAAPPLHVHSDSMGSMSSLGSSGHPRTHPHHRREGSAAAPAAAAPPASAAPDTPTNRHKRKSSGGGGSFLDLLRSQWTPPQSPSSTQPAATAAATAATTATNHVSDFHQRNQDFLNRANPSSNHHPPHPPPIPSPQPLAQILPIPHHHRRRSSSSDRPPASRGTHKRLTSISNDDWDDDGGKDDDDDDDDDDEPQQKSREEEDNQKKNSTTATTTTNTGGGGGGRSTPSGEGSAGGYSTSSEVETSDDPRLMDPMDHNNGRNVHRHPPPPYYYNGGPEGGGDDDDEQTSLLPPSGISTNERDGSGSSSGNNHRHYPQLQHPDGSYYYPSQQQQQHQQHQPPPFAGSSGEGVFVVVDRDLNGDLASTERWENRSSAAAMLEQQQQYQDQRLRQQQQQQQQQLKSSSSSRKQKGQKKKKKSKRKHKGSRRLQAQEGLVSEDSSSESNYDYRQWTQKRSRMLEKERTKLIAQWKAEAREEAEMTNHQRRDMLMAGGDEAANDRQWEVWWYHCTKRFHRWAIGLETFIANLPLTIGAVAMSVVTLGVVWFKFAEENLPYCEPVHFHSSQCTFPEFPGCFYCDTTATMYKLALGFHFACKILAGFLAMLFVLKILFSARTVLDELSSPTTASPAGLLCMTTVCVFAGRGSIGQFMVTSAACIHFCLALWFVYMALAYRIMPDPSWFPNTVGVGLSAVKMWLYYPMPGHLLMAVSLASNFFFFPISLIRVAINEKISATVGWMQMSAPAISLYALTIMAQPSFAEEHPDVTRFQRVHRIVYLPCMHGMAALSVLGFLASCHSLWRRWHDFRKKEFSPAHAAFCFPVLSHANALQAYRGAVISFSQIHPHSLQMKVLYVYWFIILVGGTIATLWITAKFLYCLPRWTNLDLSDEEEPPAPNETIIAMQDMVTAGETMRQPFVSPAVLQANETGALVLARGGPEGALRYIRTRRMPALGFEPTMNWSEMQEERGVLLDWVGEHPPRRRHRTLSVPGLDFGYGSRLGTGNSGVYGSVGDWSQQPPITRRRADTESPRAYY